MKKSVLIFLVPALMLIKCGKEEPLKFQSFDVNEVKILDGPFYKAQQADLKYMLKLDPDRLLAPYLKDAGFKPLNDNYPNWENSGLDGHIGGHYLSALAYMYAATGDEELLDRINYMLDWLEKCQEKNGNGYVGGIPDAKQMWEEIGNGNIRAGRFSLNGRWVPLYNIHKLFAGLNDVCNITGNKKALKILVNLTDWFYNLTKGLTDEQIQQMLYSEHGGLNEIFVEVYRHTGDKKYLDLARRFSDRELLGPLLKHENHLTGMHANTQIPKVIGYEQYAEETDSTQWDEAVKFFWNTVINDWTVSIGGNSVREHFNPPDDFSSMIESNQGPETCNTYNMLKLTKLLFLSDPEAKYINYYERALFNHILSSEDPYKGGFVYFTPMRPRHYRVYSQPQKGFWCCVGSGLENPGRYGEMIYAHDDKNIYVNMFIASELKWKEKDITLTQKTGFPYEDVSELRIQLDSAQKFSLNIRKPDWIEEGSYSIKVNDKKQPVQGSPYVKLNREWQSGDVVVVEFKMKTLAEFLPDKSPWVSFLCGPIVLGAITDSSNLTGLWADDSRMGHVASGKFYPIDKAPVIVTDKKDLSSAIEPIPGKPMNFRITEKVYPEKYKDLVLKPFFDIQEARYIIYWPVVDSAGLADKLQKMKEKEKAFMALEDSTVDNVATGEQQPESDHFFNGEHTSTGYFKERYWRGARGWFEYQLTDKNKEGRKLRLTYYGTDGGSDFAITMNDILVDSVKLDGSKGEKFFDVDYKLSDKVLNTNNNGKFIVKIAAKKGSYTPKIFDVRLLK